QITDELAKYAAQARTAQRLVLLQLTSPDTVRFDQRLNDQSVTELQRQLADVECTALRVELLKGVEAARAVFDKSPLDRRILHIVGDFRQRDWGDTESAGLTRALEGLAAAGVQINLIDAAHPARAESQNVAAFHDNLAVTELRPHTRVAAKDVPVEFTAT